MAISTLDIMIRQLAKLPGVGERSARRMALQLIRRKEQVMLPLIAALQQASERIRACEVCGNLDECSPCHLCTDVRRDASLLCVVEDVADLWALERSHMYRGHYHVLGGTLSAMDGRGPEALRIDSLINRASQPQVREVILATNATLEGQTTAHYLTERLSEYPLQITRLAQGIPLGGELDYMDGATLGAALEARMKF